MKQAPPPPPDPQLLSRVRDLVRETRHREALVLTALGTPDGELADGSPPLPAELAVLRARALHGLARLTAADELVTPIASPARTAEKPVDLAACEARELLARIGLDRWKPVDTIGSLARGAAADAARLGEAGRGVCVSARADAALAFARMRARARAEAELALAAPIAGDEPRWQAIIEAVRAAVLVEFDDRPAARVAYEKTLALGPAGQRAGRLGLSWVALLFGEFAEARKQLEALGERPESDLATHRRWLELFLAEEEWGHAISAYDCLLAASPRADAAREWRRARAGTMWRAGRREEAILAYRELAAEPLEDHASTFSRRMVRAIDRAPGPDARPRKKHRLSEFPTIAQLRDHCGPASCELYLRYFGLPASQVDIARAIKLPGGGTPVYAMRRFLESAGLEVRRIEADLPTLRKVLDIGLPLILEEEYSMSRHVAVAAGYDDERELLEVQDPMTHDLRETPYEELPRLLGMANHGALIAAPKGDPRLAALDAEGIREAEYIALTDRAFEARDAKQDDEGDKLVEQAIQLRKDYELAWIYKFQRARQKHSAEPGPKTRAELSRVLDEILALWPDDEWPQQYTGYVLYSEGRYADAEQAYERAVQRDNADGGNWAMLGDCRIGLNDHRGARWALEQAVARLPSHDRAIENLADILSDDRELGRALFLNDGAREKNPKNPFNHEVHARICEARGDLTGAVLSYETAVAADPNRLFAVTRHARTLARTGRIDDADKVLSAAIEKAPGEMSLKVELADLLYNNKRYERSMALCQELLAKDDKHASAYAIMGACQAALPMLLEPGLVTLRLALQLRPAYSWVYQEMGRHLLTQNRLSDALQALAAAVGLGAGSSARFLLGKALTMAGAPRDGIPHIRSAAHARDASEDAILEAAELVFSHQGLAAHGLLSDVARERAGDPAVVTAHARLLVEVASEPGLAAPILERLCELQPGSPLAEAWRGRTRIAASDAGGEADLKSALTKAPELLAAKVLYADALLDPRVGTIRPTEALAVLERARPTFAVVKQRVRAHLAANQLPEASAAIDEAFASRPEMRVPVWELSYLCARKKNDLAGALDLATRLAQATGDHEDDGRLGRWEVERFSCILGLGEVERAETYGTKQIAKAHDALSLAEAAAEAGNLEVARRFAARARVMAPESPLSPKLTALLAAT